MTILATRRAGEAPGRSMSVPRHPQSLVVFELAGCEYALPLHEVQEVVALPELSRPVGMPALLAGFLNLGGAVVPVLRLDRLFGVSEKPVELNSPLLILRLADARLALLVDRVRRIIPVSAGSILPIPEDHTFNDCVTAMVAVAEHVILQLSAERILLEKEQQCLAEFQDREQARLRELEESRP